MTQREDNHIRGSRSSRGRNLAAGLLFAVVAAPALANTCTFTTECFEAEGCAETSFDMTIEDGQLVTDAQTIPVTLGGSDETRVYVGITESAFHVLTQSASGIARYSTHIYSGPLMVNYLGECSD